MSNKNCTYTFLDGQGQKQTIVGLSSMKAFLVDGGLDLLYPGGKFPWLSTESAIDLIRPSALQAITPDQAGNMRAGDVAVDDQGREYMVLHARHKWLEVAPIVDGRPQVSADTTIKFHLEPETKHLYRERRGDPIYATGRNRYNQEAAAESRPAAEPSPSSDQFAGLIAIAADSIESLRRSDVDRVITEAPTELKQQLAAHIKAKRPDLAGEVDGVMAEASESKPVEQADIPKLTQAEAAKLMEWQSLGQKDGIKTHILTFYESRADKDAKRGRMTMATVTSGDRSSDKWSIDGDDQSFTYLAAAKKRGMEVGMAKAVKDGFVDGDSSAGGAEVNGRDAFTLQRMNDATGQMEPVTFKRGETIKIAAGQRPYQTGVITGISQAERKFKVDGLDLAHDFGYAYKADFDESARPKGEVDAELDKLEKRLNDGIAIQADGFIRTAKDVIERNSLGDYAKGRIAQLEKKASEVSGNALEKMRAETMEREAKEAKERTDAQAKVSEPKPAIDMTMDEWKAISKDFKGNIDGQRMVMRDGGMRPVNIVKPKAAAADQPASTTPATDAHVAIMDAVREGKTTPEQFKAGFEAFVANKTAILAELDAKTKVQLLRAGGPYIQMRHASDKKADVVDAIYRQMLGEYVLGESVTYGMGKDSYLNAVRQMVEATDVDKLERYVQDRKAALEEIKARREAKAAAIQNPQTLADFQEVVRDKVRDGMSSKDAFLSLTPEQRIQYDTLAAESTKEARESRKRSMAARVSAAGQTTGGQIIATKHTRDGYDLFVAQLADRLSSEDYKTMLASAKRLGGWYSSFRGNGATPGFQFKDRAVAEAFLKLAGGDTTAATEQIEQRRDTFEDDRSQTAVERLRSMADKLEGQANEEEGRDRKANTARRARFASAALASAAADKAKAKTMRNIAQAIEDGKAKFLDGVRTKSQVDMLTSIVETAKANELRAKYPNYADQEKRKGEPPTAETADFAEFPNYSAFRSDLATLGRQLLEVEGTKKLGQRLMSVADDVTDAYLEFAKDNLLKVSQFGRGDSMADFSNKDDAERALKRSGLTGKAIVLQVKRGQNRVILSPGEAIGRGIWTGDGDKRITLTAEFGNELVEAIGRRGNKSNRLTVPWQFQNAYDRRKALTRIGIETASEYRSALREFIALKEQATANKVRELELQMVGRKKDGLDFFPTSADVADQMIEAADLSPDMAVLEPSAGMGHLADRIRAAGAEPDVIEISPDRRELLEEKGYHLAEVDDFMIMEPRKFFTFGDVYRAPDGTEGIMRGVGRMGSQRVRLEDEAGNRLGLYDRSELTGIRHRGVWSGYDRIIMNPPFSKRQDAEHVRHAYELLKPGGRIVAIMGEGVFFGQDQKAQEFREWLESIGGTSEKLPDGSFMDPSLPVNTAVNARMVVIDKPAAETPAFSRTKPKATSLSAAEASSIVSAITSRWDNAPDVVVVADMQDAAVPLRVREYDAEQRSLGAQGEPEGFWFGGKVYLVAKSMGTPSDVMRVLFHEALGHYGLRGVFGNRLDAILQQIASLRRSEVEAKAKQYGLDMSIEAQRLQAAEEVLAVMAQTNPKLGFVKRAIGAIRSWLRRTMPGLFGQMELTDAEIIRDYILPARAFVERGATGKAAGGAAFSRNDSPIRAALGELIQAEAAWDAVRQGDPKNVTLSQYMALTDRSLAAKKAATAQLAELPNDGFALQAEASGGRMLILTPSAQQPGRWQLTRFSPDGNPWGDTNFDTKQQAIREFLDEADLTTIVTGDGTAFSRSQDQTRTEAFKRWYSGDYGSTPDASSRNGATGSAIQGTSGEANGGVVGRGNDVRPAVLGSKGVGQAARISVDGGQIIFDGASGPTDPSGKPVVFYHGTKADITTFNTDHPNKKDNGWLGRGVYVASNSDAAELYAVQKRDGEAENVMPVYVAVRNPYVFSDAERSRYKNATPIGVQRLTERLKAQGYDGVVYDHGGDKGVELVAFRPEQVKSAIGNNGDFDPANPDIRFSRAMPAPSPQPAAWEAPADTYFDRRVVYALQDKHIDTKRVQAAITKTAGEIEDELNAYQREELYHGRAAKRAQDFLTQELNPMVEQLAKDKIELADFEEYLHARHAPEANRVLAERNPNQDMIDAGLEAATLEIEAVELELAATTDPAEIKLLSRRMREAQAELSKWSSVQPYRGTEEDRLRLSGMSDDQARAIMDALTPEQRAKLDDAAAQFDAIVGQNRQLMVDYDLEDQETIDSWGQLFQHYVPLMREDEGNGVQQGMGTGQGFSIKGREVKSRTGSTRKVVDIVANVAMQRERIITRGEKNRVSQALMGLAALNPNPDFWKLGAPDRKRQYDPATNTVKVVTDPKYKDRENVVVAKVRNSKGHVTEVALTFNERDPRAVRMAAAIKNLEDGQLNWAMTQMAKVTRYLASINTQYNPIFGIVNVIRDLQGAAVNLAGTPLKDSKTRVIRNAIVAIGSIYRGARKERKGGENESDWGKLWQEFQEVGGMTGFRDQFRDSQERARAIERTMNPEKWMESAFGKIVTVGGALKMPMTWAQEGAGWVAGWLSDYNLAMENGVRLSAYKEALDKGMSREQAASLAKNLTVNFNRRGSRGMQMGAAYAFFNAAMQGTARMGQAFTTMEDGKLNTLRLSPLGKKVLTGGLMMGVAQAVVLAAAGFGDDEPPEFVREKNLIIPTGWTGMGSEMGYVTIPMPLGLHVIPGLGRHMAEFAMSGGKDPAGRVISIFGMLLDAFNPIGNAGASLQSLFPTVADPFIALAENKDFTGRNIALPRRDENTPGHQLAKDTASSISKFLSEAINFMTGGNEYVKGEFSPTPDQIDYLFGQVTGGVGREALKAEQTIRGAITGEEVPLHKIPLAGRFVGDSSGSSGQASIFRANLNRLDRAQMEIDGLREDGRIQESNALRQRSDPYLLAQARAAESQVQRLRRMKRDMVDKGASRESVREVERKISEAMGRLNKAVESRAQ